MGYITPERGKYEEVLQKGWPGVVVESLSSSNFKIRVGNDLGIASNHNKQKAYHPDSVHFKNTKKV